MRYSIRLNGSFSVAQDKLGSDVLCTVGMFSLSVAFLVAMTSNLKGLFRLAV